MASKPSHTPAPRTAAKQASKPSRAKIAGSGEAGLARPAADESVAKKLPHVSRSAIASAKKKFHDGIIARGEAVKAGTRMPPGATHEIAGKECDGSPVLKRKRFSIT